MSQPDLSSARPRGVLIVKPKTNIYTVMLMISTLCMAIGSLLMWLEYSRLSAP